MSRRLWRSLKAGGWLGLVFLAGCVSAPYTALPGTDNRPVMQKARWVAVDWVDLPGWEQDQVQQAWPALLRSCARASLPAWVKVCLSAKQIAANEAVSETRIRAWMQQNLRPYLVETLDGQAQGLLTGYFEPILNAHKNPDAIYNTPLYAPPSDLAARQPYWSRTELETLTEAKQALEGRAVAYLADPLDAMVLQIQGSGRLRLLDSVDAATGQPRMIRLAFAGHNGHPYVSIGRWLIDQGQIGPNQASWSAIRAWTKLHPERVAELLRANPRVIFFREEVLLNPEQGPMGAQGVELIPGRSIAVDPAAIPYGTPVWLASTAPPAAALPTSTLPSPLQRLVVAQDTGQAIRGAVRADYFWGWGAEAEALASRTKQPLRLWVLWPNS